MIQKFSLCLILCCTAFLSKAQEPEKVLYIKKHGSIAAERIMLHDNVLIKASDSTSWQKGMLTEINKEYISLYGKKYLLEDIEAMRTSNGLLPLLSKTLWVGGVFFTSIIFVNRLINKDEPLMTSESLILGSALVAGGVLVHPFSINTYKKSKGYIFEVIDFSDLNEQDE